MTWRSTSAVPGPLRTERLRLDPLSVDDASDMVGVLADEALYEFTGDEPPDLPTLEQRYRALAEGAPDPNETWMNWIIRSVDDATPVGFVQATVVGDSASLAWLIAVDHQGHGWATEAARAMCDWIAHTGVVEFDAHIHPDHTASQRVAARLGLELTDRVDDDGEQIWSTAGRRRSPPAAF